MVFGARAVDVWVAACTTPAAVKYGAVADAEICACSGGHASAAVSIEIKTGMSRMWRRPMESWTFTYRPAHSIFLVLPEIRETYRVRPGRKIFRKEADPRL